MDRFLEIVSEVQTYTPSLRAAISVLLCNLVATTQGDDTTQQKVLKAFLNVVVPVFSAKKSASSNSTKSTDSLEFTQLLQIFIENNRYNVVNASAEFELFLQLLVESTKAMNTISWSNASSLLEIIVLINLT